MPAYTVVTTKPRSVRIKILGADNLHSRRFLNLRRQSPFVEVVFGARTRRTSEDKKGGENPRWRDDWFTFDYHKEVLYVDFLVLEKGMTRERQEIARGRFSLLSLDAEDYRHSDKVRSLNLWRNFDKAARSFAGVLKFQIEFENFIQDIPGSESRDAFLHAGFPPSDINPSSPTRFLPVIDKPKSQTSSPAKNSLNQKSKSKPKSSCGDDKEPEPEVQTGPSRFFPEEENHLHFRKDSIADENENDQNQNENQNHGGLTNPGMRSSGSTACPTSTHDHRNGGSRFHTENNEFDAENNGNCENRDRLSPPPVANPGENSVSTINTSLTLPEIPIWE